MSAREAPKRASSSFMLYSTDVRPQVNAKNPNMKFGDVAKTVGDMWKKLGEKEKAKYAAKAATLKAKYIKEKAKWDKLPEDMKIYPKKKGKKNKKRKRDPNMPKRGRSAYIWFGQQERKKIKDSGKAMTVTEIMKMIAKKWSECSKADKAKFEAMAVKDKARYQKELAKYKATQQ